MSIDLYFAGVPSNVTFPAMLPSDGGEAGSGGSESAGILGVNSAAAEIAGAGACWLVALGTKRRRTRTITEKKSAEMTREAERVAVSASLETEAGAAK